MFGKFKYNKKVTIVLAGGILLPFIIIFFVFFAQQVSDIYNKVDKNVQRVIVNVEKNATEISSMIYQKSRFLTLYSELNKELMDAGTEIQLEEKLNRNKMVNDVVDALVSNNKIYNVIVYTTNRNASLGVIQHIEDNVFFDKLVENPLGQWMIEEDGALKMLSFYRKYNLSTDDYHVIKITTPFKSILDGFKDIEYKNSYIKIHTPTLGDMVFTYNSGKYSECELPKNGLYAVDGKIESLGMDVSVYVDKGVIYRSICMLLLACLFVLCLIVLIVYLIANLISNNLFTGISDMVDGISTDNMEIIKKSTYKSREVEIIKNYLLDTQVKLKEENEERMKFELELLAERISPHFLYNNLSAIRSKCESNSAKDAIDNLVKYYRNVFHKGNRTATMEAEIKNGIEYLNLLKFSYENDFEIIVDIDDECMKKTIPANVLQPVLENAFIHGINSRDVKGCIEIKAVPDGKDVIVTVTDNGGTFNEARFKQRMQDNKNHAIKTIKTRMKLYYNDEKHSVNISGYADKTVVTFRF